MTEAIRTWRLLEEGPRPAAWQIAMGAALLEARAGGLSPDTFRFVEFAHPCLLLGAHQPAPESAGEMQRRITGGPAVHVDPRQLAWEISASKGDLAGPVADAVVETLREHGYPADRGPDCVLLNRRPVCWTVETSHKQALLLQGFLSVEGETSGITLFEAGGGRAPSLDELRTTLAEGIVRRLGLSLEPGEATMEERAHLAQEIPAFRREEWIRSVRLPEGTTTEATTIGRGAAVRASVLHGPERNRIARVVFSGEFCAHPRGAVRGLEEDLADTAIDEAPARIENYFARTGAEVPGLAPGDFFTALSLAFMKRRVAQSAAPDPLAWKKELGR